VRSARRGRPRDGDPGAVDPPLRIDLDQVDAQPRFAHLDGARHSGDTAAYDQNPLDFSHPTVPPEGINPSLETQDRHFHNRLWRCHTSVAPYSH
jgi:hypothetical protein